MPNSIRLVRIDADQQLIQIRYFLSGQLPEERFWLFGRPAEPIFSKVRDLTYLDRVLMHERIVWLPATAEIRVSINGRRMPLEFGPQPEPVVYGESDT